jgi:bla regulator protein blaR1
MIPGLGRHLIESTVLAMAAAVLAHYFMRHREAAARHAVWLIAAAKFAVPAGIFSAAGTWLAGFFPAPHTLALGVSEFPTLLPGLHSSLQETRSIIGITGLFVWVWLAGVGVMLGHWVSRLFTSLGRTSPATDSELRSQAAMQQRLGVRRTIRLLHSDSDVEPSLTGLWKPAITFPRGLSQELSRAELEAVLLHELAHAKRWDNLSSGFVHALACVFWFHPLLWWIESRVNAESEFACDELVVRSGVDPEEYVAGIVKVCHFHLNDAIAGACRISGSNLKNRLEVIMSYRSRQPNSRAFGIFPVALASLMIALPLAGGFLGSSTLAAQAAKVSKPPAGATDSKAPVNCANASKYFLEGTVIQYANGAQRMCVKGPNGYPMWVRTNQAARERSTNVIVIPPTPQPPAFLCEAAASTRPDTCACKEHGDFSLGAIVNSANGSLRCVKGGKWRAATPAELGEKK